MPEIPHNRWPDSTLALASDPYPFISGPCRRCRSNLFQTRILLRKTICMIGAEMARLIYDADRLHAAAPRPSDPRRCSSARAACRGWTKWPTAIAKPRLLRRVGATRQVDIQAGHLYCVG